MNSIALNLIRLWPVVTALLATYIFNKQNSSKAWTGGPISMPKAMWLAYTVCNWFFLPIFFLYCSDFPVELKLFFCFHLLSWWTRGSLELVMIYRWLNWSPRYGISHDIFHLVISAILLSLAFTNTEWVRLIELSFAASVFAFVLIFSVMAEIVFATMFLNIRNQKEQDENIYFASKDPKWIMVNRLTAGVAAIVYVHLIWQSFYLTI